MQLTGASSVEALAGQSGGLASQLGGKAVTGTIAAGGKGVGFDPVEWYRNCAGLVEYFTGQVSMVLHRP
jgi:hypothetical protein